MRIQKKIAVYKNKILKRIAVGKLSKFSSRSDKGVVFRGTVLIDAQWYNPNYVLRYSLMRRALGLFQGKEVALLNKWSRPYEVILKKFGINECQKFGEYEPSQSEILQIDQILNGIQEADDIFTCKFPEAISNVFVYDAILKNSREASVTVIDDDVKLSIRTILLNYYQAKSIIRKYCPNLLVVSHHINVDYHALVAAAVSENVPVYFIFGMMDSNRFFRISCKYDYVNWYGCDKDFIDKLSEKQKTELRANGSAYLNKRLLKETNDISAQYAFHYNDEEISRNELCDKFGWSPKDTIIAIYAHNWFDMPHGCGMTYYKDFLDWMNVTIDAVKKNRSVRWLLKPHPCDEWYGGKSLGDYIDVDSEPHVQFVEDKWNSFSVMNSVDAIVTVHGTIGLEYSALGKPVLLADKGWYSECKIGKCSQSVEEYKSDLASDWWKQVDVLESKRQAQIFLGIFASRPESQENFIQGDDSRQEDLYGDIIHSFRSARKEITQEVDWLREWVASDEKNFHYWKIQKNSSYRI